MVLWSLQILSSIFQYLVLKVQGPFIYFSSNKNSKNPFNKFNKSFWMFILLKKRFELVVLKMDFLRQNASDNSRWFWDRFHIFQ